MRPVLCFLLFSSAFVLCFGFNAGQVFWFRRCRIVPEGTKNCTGAGGVHCFESSYITNLFLNGTRQVHVCHRSSGVPVLTNISLTFEGCVVNCDQTVPATLTCQVHHNSNNSDNNTATADPHHPGSTHPVSENIKGVETSRVIGPVGSASDNDNGDRKATTGPAESATGSGAEPEISGSSSG